MMIDMSGHDLKSVNSCKPWGGALYPPTFKHQKEKKMKIETMLKDQKKVEILILPHGILIKPQSYGVLGSKNGYPILLEWEGETPVIHVWGDIKKEDSTHRIDLKLSKESNAK